MERFETALRSAQPSPSSSHPSLTLPQSSTDLTTGAAAGFASGGPSTSGGIEIAPSLNPAIAEDTAGNVYVAFAANDTTTGHWLIFFTESTGGEGAFSGAVQVGPTPGTNVQDVSPTIAVYGSGATAKVAIAYETMTGYTGYGGYEYLLSTNGGTSFTSEGTQAKLGDSEVYGPAVAWSAGGADLLVGYWGADDRDCGPTGADAYYVNAAEVDDYTSGTTYASSLYNCLLTASTSTYIGVVSIACGTSGTDCSMLYDVAKSDTSGWTVVAETFSDTLATYAIGATLATGTCTSCDTVLTALLGSNDLAYTGAATAVAAYETGSGTPPPYVMGYSSTTNDWTGATVQTSPSGSTSVNSGAIGTAGNGDVILSWQDAASAVVETAWASAAGGTFTSTLDVAGGTLGNFPSDSGTTAVSPWRGDWVWVNDSTTPTSIYYSYFLPLSTTASVAPTKVDLGQTVAFSSTPSNGIAAYTYSWSFGGACTSCPTTVQNPSGVNYTSSGSYTASVTVTDAIGETATASAGTVTVNAALTLALSPASATADAGQAVAFTATAAGGSTVYSSYGWRLNGATQSGTSSTNSITFSAAGTDTVSAEVTDSLGMVAWTSATVTVNSALTATLAFSPATVAVGGSTTATTTAKGGTTPYASYAYSGLPAGCSSTVSSFTCSPTATGWFHVNATVTDSASPAATATAPALLIVDSAMTVTATSFPGTPIVGQAVFLNASVAGGTSPHTYTWSPGDGTHVLTGTSVSHAYSSAATFTVQVWVNDSLGLSVTKTITVTVLQPLSITAKGTPPTTNTTTTVTFTGTATGGTGTGYAYSWNFGDGTTGTGGTSTHLYSTANTYTVTLTVTDSAFHTATQSITEVVQQGSTGCGSSCTLVVTISYTPTDPVAGLPVQFTAGATGGSGSYSYSWTFGDGGTGSGSSPTHTYANAGTYAVVATATDSKSNTGNQKVTVQVQSASSGLTPSVTASPSPADVGQLVTFDGTAIGGTGTYTSFSFNFGDGTAPVQVTTSPATTTHSYTAAGTYSVTVTVTDSSGASKTSSPTNVVVDPALTVTVTSTSPGYDVGVFASFTATPSGGSGSFDSSVAWTFGTAQVSGVYTEGQTFSSSGTVQVEAQIEDTVTGALGSGFLNVTIYPKVTVVITSDVTDSPAPAYVNLTATISGGHEPYTLVWTFGDGTTSAPLSSSSQTFTIMHKYQNAGGFEASVKVADTFGGSGTGTYNGTVASPSPQPGGLLGGSSVIGIPWWVLLVILAIVVAAVVLIVVARRRKPEPPAENLEVFAPAAMAGAVAAGVPVDMMAPPVPVGASDLSPDDFGGTLPPEPGMLPPGTRVAEAATALPAPSPVPGTGAPGSALICPNCGSGLLGEAIPCPTCQFVASPDLASSGIGVAGAVPPLAAGAPIAAPSAEPLTHCPQCSGPLTPTGDCPVCQLHWEPEQRPPQGGAPTTTGPGVPGGGPHGALAPVLSSTDLTHCPQCGNPLAAGRVCTTCQVSWEPSAQGAPGLAGPSGEEKPLPPVSPLGQAPPSRAELSGGVPPAPVVTELPRPAAPASSNVPAPTLSSPPPPAVEAAPPSVPTTPAPPKASPPAPEAASAAVGGAPHGRCFICSGPLEDGYCARCNMSWADEGN